MPLNRRYTHMIFPTAIAALSLLCLVVAASPSSHPNSKVAFIPSYFNSQLASVMGVNSLGRPLRSQQRLESFVMLAKKRRKKSSSSSMYSDDESDRILSETTVRDDTTINERPTVASGEPARTLSGGPSLIFEMARRMLVWDDELYQGLNDASRGDKDGNAIISTALSNNVNSSTNAPRWRPSPLLQRSISNVNPAFRTSSPIMTSAGYAGILRRNSRKKMKPSMWRHCLRVYDKMADLEKIEIEGSKKKPAIRRKTVHHEAALVAASKLAMWEEAIKIYHSVEELPLASNSKAYKAVVGIGDGSAPVNPIANNTSTQATINARKVSAVTDNMILSIISACVKGSKVKRTASMANNALVSKDTDNNSISDVEMNATSLANTTALPGLDSSATRPLKRGTMRLLTIEERRKPLDEARNILLSMEDKHDIPLVSRHVNPLAAAYMCLGLRSDAAELINMLKDRDPPPPPSLKKNTVEFMSDYEYGESLDEDDEDLDDDEDEFNAGYEEPQLNIHQVQAKDRGSYALMVQGAVMEEDWVGAVRELQKMTEVGLHPNSRNLNSWAQVMEPSCRPAGNNMDKAAYSRKGRKKRDRMWLDTLSR